MKFFQPRRKILELTLIFLMGSLVSLPSFDQTTIEMNEFNAAYFQYGEMKDTDLGVAREAARRAYELGKNLFGVASERSAMLAVNYATLLENVSIVCCLISPQVPSSSGWAPDPLKYMVSAPAGIVILL